MILNLKNQALAIKIYSVLKCGNKKFRLPTVEGVNVEWNEMFIFYAYVFSIFYLKNFLWTT